MSEATASQHISTLGLFGLSTIQRRVGPDKIDYEIPEALKKYTKDNYMGGVDSLDKDKCIGGSFTGRAMSSIRSTNIQVCSLQYLFVSRSRNHQSL